MYICICIYIYVYTYTYVLSYTSTYIQKNTYINSAEVRESIDI